MIHPFRLFENFNKITQGGIKKVMMGIPSVIVVPSCGDVIVDLDRAVSDGYEYGAANEGFDEEYGAGMCQQAGERICERMHCCQIA